MASSDSVTTDILADEERQFSDGRLSGEPPLAYLDESESPAFVLTNGKKGLGLGAKRNTTSPDSDRGSIFLLTGERTICLIGQDDGDETYSIPHESIAWVSYHTSFFSNRLELRTPSKAYHCWADRTTGESLLADVVSFIEERQPPDPTPIPGDSEASVFTWRGGDVE